MSIFLAGVFELPDNPSMHRKITTGQIIHGAIAPSPADIDGQSSTTRPNSTSVPNIALI